MNHFRFKFGQEVILDQMVNKKGKITKRTNTKIRRPEGNWYLIHFDNDTANWYHESRLSLATQQMTIAVKGGSAVRVMI